MCSPGTASQRRDSDRYASAPASLRPSRTLRSPAFDRFDEILYLVENAPDLALTEFRAPALNSVATSL